MQSKHELLTTYGCQVLGLEFKEYRVAKAAKTSNEPDP